MYDTDTNRIVLSEYVQRSEKLASHSQRLSRVQSMCKKSNKTSTQKRMKKSQTNR